MFIGITARLKMKKAMVRSWQSTNIFLFVIWTENNFSQTSYYITNFNFLCCRLWRSRRLWVVL